jgi:hypothetical protein
MDGNLWESLAQLGRDLDIVHDAEGNHSELIREMVSASVNQWRETPYVCQSADYVVLVTGEGQVFFRQVQVIRLNRKREKLPCLLDMKPEKKRDFLTDYHADEATWLRSHWLINYFGAWHGSDISGELLDDCVDRKGIDVKQADLLVDQVPGTLLTREIIVGAQDYVQRRQKHRKHEYDRVGFPVDIPTRNLKALVVVDIDLYQRESVRPKESPLLELEFRNRESARFEGVFLDPWNPMSKTLAGRHLKDALDPHAEGIRSELGKFKERIETLAQSSVKDGPIVTPEQQVELNRILQIPEQFLYYSLAWPSPYLGMEVCVRWQKPEEKC